MSAKLTRKVILRDLLNTLVNGWGRKAVIEALEDIVGPTSSARTGRSSVKSVSNEPKAVQLIEKLELSDTKKELFDQLAREFDAGRAFPKIFDVRAFLFSHLQNAKEVRSRGHGFQKMIPILEGMSEKGLMNLISRSHHSGPAELDPISDAIKGMGEDLRGGIHSDKKSSYKIGWPCESWRPNISFKLRPLSLLCVRKPP